MRRWLVGFLSLIIFLAPSASVEAAVQPGVGNVDDFHPRDCSFCWLWKSSTPMGWEPIRSSTSRVSRIVASPELRAPGTSASLMKSLHTVRGLSLEALSYQVPLWRAESVSASSIGNGKDLCAPDPIVDIHLSSQPVTQGQTMVLHLTTRRPIECEISYLDRAVPCYRAEDDSYYALLSFSALTPPGEYPLHVSLSAEDRIVSFEMDIELASGHYGYQFIDPPVALNGLLDRELMELEWAYLKPWRDLRSSDRMWTYPLGPPLERVPSISADYGDRRSYGGMFEGYHSGVDYRASTGTIVISPAAGRIVLTQRLAARGNVVLVNHGWGLVTGYWHLSAIDVEVGDIVAKGDTLGRVGNTGLSTGSHLHWEVWVNGVAVDGRQWLNREGLPLDFPLPTDSDSGDGLSESSESHYH